MIPPANLNHLALRIRSYEQARAFYCNILGLSDRSVEAGFLSIEVGRFILNFIVDSNFEKSWTLGVDHIGIQFETRSEIEIWHTRLARSPYAANVSSLRGGMRQGPYRFYVLDPHGYRLEFESWEGCSD